MKICNFALLKGHVQRVNNSKIFYAKEALVHLYNETRLVREKLKFCIILLLWQHSQFEPLLIREIIRDSIISFSIPQCALALFEQFLTICPKRQAFSHSVEKIFMCPDMDTYCKICHRKDL